MLQEIEKGFYGADTFDDVKGMCEDFFRENGIKTLYKIRNWRERFHPEFLENGEIYFARPNELNDPFDISRPVKYNTGIIETPEYFNFMVEAAIKFFKVNPGDDAETFARNKLAEMRKDPNAYFLNSYMQLIQRHYYNNGKGIFSLSTNVCEEQLWGYYGGGLKGFAVGFEPIGLCEELFPAQYNLVDYTNEIVVSEIINRTVKDTSMTLFQKQKKWGFESEFRFVRRYSVDDNYQSDSTYRKHYFSPQIVKEIILGPRTPIDDETKIIPIAKERYPNAKLFRLVCDYSTAKMNLQPI